MDFNSRNKCLTVKLLQQGYRYHKRRKPFSKLYRRHYELIFKFNVALMTLLREGFSEPEFYGDLIYKFEKLIGRNDFSFQFRKIITRYRHISYKLTVMRQSACLVRGSGVRLYDDPDKKLFILVGWDRGFLYIAWPTRVQLFFLLLLLLLLLLLRISVSYSAPNNLHRRAASPSSISLLNL